MANQAEPIAMGGAFVEDAEAQARFVAHKRYLAWRRRLLPVVAIARLPVAVVAGGRAVRHQAVHRAVAGGGGGGAGRSASTC